MAVVLNTPAKRVRAKRIATGLCADCGKRPPIAGANYCVPCRQRQSSKSAQAHSKFKRIIYDYFGSSCQCCGESEPMFLTIDHVNNNGNVARKQDKTGGTNFYRVTAKRIQAGNPPTDLQILCRNCNWGKHVNGGTCPHKSGYEAI